MPSPTFRSPRSTSRLSAVAWWASAVLAASLAACGPIAGPWGTIGGEWGYVCGAPRQVGEACATNESCAVGLYCAGTGNNKPGVCQARIASGGTCQLSEDCQAGLVCKLGVAQGVCYQQSCANDVCTQGSASGAKCDSNGLACPANQICQLGAPGPSTCVPTPKAGDDCNQFASLRQCGDQLVCLRGSFKCGPPPTEGQLCAMPPMRCAPGLACLWLNDPNKIDDWCGKPIAVGGACTGGGQCVKGAHCDLGKLVCTPNRKVGDACKSGNECGEPPFDVQGGLDCVQGKCVDTSVVGGKCWPGADHMCSNGLVCVPKPG